MVSPGDIFHLMF